MVTITILSQVVAAELGQSRYPSELLYVQDRENPEHGSAQFSWHLAIVLILSLRLGEKSVRYP